MRTSLLLCFVAVLISLTQGQFFGRRPSRNFGGGGGLIGGFLGGGNRGGFRGNRGGFRGNRGAGGGELCLGQLCGGANFDRRTGGLTGNACFRGNCDQLNFRGGSDGRGGMADQECFGNRCNQLNIGGGAPEQDCFGAQCRQFNLGRLFGKK